MSPSSPHTTLPSPSSLSQPATASASAAAPDSMTIQPPATAPSALLASANPAESPISQFRSLSDIYANPTGEQARWEHLINTFEERHGRKPSHVVRAPGRCNVLGEHVDYSLFPVLPAAIEQDILFAISPTSSPLVNISNIQTRFKPASIPLIRHKLTGAWDVELDSFEGWESYMKAVLKQGLATYFSGRDGKGPVGMDIVVSGNVPPGSGLSSSAAFVVAGMLSFLTANNLATGLRMNDLVQLAIASEHRMGVQTGGMDQAASVLGQKSSLSHISFHPTLSSSPVQISPRIAIVITNSLSPHSLGDSAARQYNLRVVETCLAARLLAHAWGLGEHPVVKVESKARVRLMEVLALKRERDGERGIEEMMRDVEAVLGRDGRGEKGWTREEMRAASGMKGEDFDRVYFGTFLRVEADHFHLLRRTRHILLENERVSRFCHLSSTSSTSPSTSSLSEEDTLAEFGALLNASHASCAGDYDCTVPQTDALQALCVRLGSLGSRQTGGGWGGAVISLVKVEEADAFLESVKREYGPYKGLKEEEVRGEAFVTRPGMGAGVYTYTGHVL